jgi:glycogen phosphorylase
MNANTIPSNVETQSQGLGKERPEILDQPQSLDQEILNNLYFIQGKSTELATLNDWYMAVAFTVRARLMKNWIGALHGQLSKEVKIVGYLSAEFLMGPHLGNALINLDLLNEFKEATGKLGLDLRSIMEVEEEPGLGNGGLGRLAACYLDSLTTLKVPAIGYGIRYEFGLFDQQIRDGWQFEITDKWLRLGNPWEIARPELNFRVKLGGYTKFEREENGSLRIKWIPSREVKGVAYDTPVPGYKNKSINLLRLWKSEAVESFNFDAFNRGNYREAVDEKIYSENIGKVLYPNDESEQGKRLRLTQQYFFVSCSLQDTIKLHELRGLALEELPASVSLQMNDTHPTIAVAELMRILVDEKLLDWDSAWKITEQILAYTNHTLLPEALEKWPLTLFASILPRHLEIIYEINSRFLTMVRNKYPGDDQKIRRLSIIDEDGERWVRMAHLACIGSHAVNGVSALHAELVKTDLLNEFYKLNPEKFLGVTNGVTPRRWMKLYSPQLSDLISKKIGDEWITRMEDNMIALESFATDPDFQHQWRHVKKGYKIELAGRISRFSDNPIDPDSLFDVMVKRIHEYKRQLLNVLHIIHQYIRIKRDPGIAMVPRTFIFGGKAAPGYQMAKLIIKLIHSVGDRINNDPLVGGRIRVFFFPDFNVKNSEWVYRAADLSEQISTAGKEASGTGNMKFTMNGALTMGTMDGANIEIREAVGAENFFLFGMTVEDIRKLQITPYRPNELYFQDEGLKETIDHIMLGEFSNGDRNIFKPITDSLLSQDPYYILKDFRSYIERQQEASGAYSDVPEWTKMSILNVARSGIFSSDRAIREYCDKIWKVKIK